MKKLLLVLFVAIFTLSCSREEILDTRPLNVPDIYWGDFIGTQTSELAVIRGNSVFVADKLIVAGTVLRFEQNATASVYEVALPDGEKLFLTTANGYVGISVINADGSPFIIDYFTEN